MATSKKVKWKDRAYTIALLVLGILVLVMYLDLEGNEVSWAWAFAIITSLFFIASYLRWKTKSRWNLYAAIKKIRDMEEYPLDAGHHVVEVHNCEYSPGYRCFYFPNNGITYVYDTINETVEMKIKTSPRLFNWDIQRSRKLDLEYGKEMDRLRKRDEEFKEGIVNETEEN